LKELNNSKYRQGTVGSALTLQAIQSVGRKSEAPTGELSVGVISDVLVKFFALRI